MKKRSKYRPKYNADNVMSTVFGGMSGEHAAHMNVLKIKNHRAMLAIVAGSGTRTDWDMLVGAINMGNVMCEQGIGDEFRGSMIAGRDAMRDVGARAIKVGKFAFSGTEMQAMNEAMECHDAQIENIRAIDMQRAADEVLRRLSGRINTMSVRRGVSAAS